MLSTPPCFEPPYSKYFSFCKINRDKIIVLLSTCDLLESRCNLFCFHASLQPCEYCLGVLPHVSNSGYAPLHFPFLFLHCFPLAMKLSSFCILINCNKTLCLIGFVVINRLGNPLPWGLELVSAFALYFWSSIWGGDEVCGCRTRKGETTW